MALRTIEIYRSQPRAEWHPNTPQYYFRPEAEGHEPYCLIDVPDHWFLIGEPQPLLVMRLDHYDFRTMTATDALYCAIARSQGFSMATGPEDGVPAALNVESVRRMSKSALPAAEPPDGRALPAPAKNGRKPR
jgi:hypothetical protein